MKPFLVFIFLIQATLLFPQQFELANDPAASEINTLPYSLKLKTMFNFKSEGIKVTYCDADSGKQKAALSIYLYFYKYAFDILDNDITPDSLKSFDPVSNCTRKELTFNFDKMPLKWDNTRKVFSFVGNFPLKSLNKREENLLIPGCMLFQHTKKGCIFNMYLEVTTTTWYYFEYYYGEMRCVSSNDIFNDFIRGPSKSKRTLNAGKKKQYYYTIAKKPNARLFARFMYGIQNSGQ